ncbi:MAG: class I SAM-dependent methyltransferase [Actinomycetota bacterium]|nr:class I SAM-dependent methyltransferase [Actinomycetota bacterium]
MRLRRRAAKRQEQVPAPAAWPLRLPEDLPTASLEEVRAAVERLDHQSQYGWGHTIEFGPFRKEGLLGESYLQIAGCLDAWSWWAPEGSRVADVGCFTGGLSLLMAARRAETVYAVDEIPEHVEQCAFLADAFRMGNVRPLTASLYHLGEHLEPASLDQILLSGVLYHLSDMLAGLVVLQELLKPGGVLLIESNAVDSFEHSYANFGRFYAGMWWQPTALCIQDLCEFAGLERPQVRFYTENRCLARAVKADGSRVPFRRGLSIPSDQLRDDHPRPLDPSVMRPAPHPQK